MPADLTDLFCLLNQCARDHAGGIRQLARELGKVEKTLYAKLQPDDDLHQPTIGEFVAILYRLGDEQRDEVLETFCSLFGYGVTTRVTRSADSIMQAVLTASAEHGDIARTVSNALADGTITHAERQEILRQCAEARRAISVLENTIHEKQT